MHCFERLLFALYSIPALFCLPKQEQVPSNRWKTQWHSCLLPVRAASPDVSCCCCLCGTAVQRVPPKEQQAVSLGRRLIHCREHQPVVQQVPCALQYPIGEAHHHETAIIIKAFRLRSDCLQRHSLETTLLSDSSVCSTSKVSKLYRKTVPL